MPSEEYNEGFAEGEHDRHAIGGPQPRSHMPFASNDFLTGYFHGATGTSGGGERSGGSGSVGGGGPLDDWLRSRGQYAQ